MMTTVNIKGGNVYILFFYTTSVWETAVCEGIFRMEPTDSKAPRTAVVASNVSGPTAAVLRAVALVTRKNKTKVKTKAKSKRIYGDNKK